ncbi:DNA primase [Synechococcus virus S-ESS1]|uniref:DNA primase n=1 Tax=Synechococcus virus S-ESS1 TaxID=1964565 RepID=A0A1V0DX47_9CAUD|nr:DNA helicase [Synechococcus virus S-ESS1]ARB05736.1 DNA primase [Synechococcus virus S-ESS1]
MSLSNGHRARSPGCPIWVGTTSNGAVVYDDMWVYSHHGSDPCQEMLVNAYDLVRIHKFGKEDKDKEKDTPIKDLPSTKKMSEWLRSDANFRVAQAESRYDLEDMLADDDVEYETEDRPGARELVEGVDEDEQAEIDSAIEDLVGNPVETPWSKRKSRQMTRRQWAALPPKRWIAKKLELTDDGIIKTTMHNIAYIVLYDPRFFRKVAFNLFSKSVVMVGDFKSKMELIPNYKCADKHNGEDWQEINDIIVRTIIEAPAGTGQSGYGIKVGKETVHDAVRIAANRNSFHPILEYLDDLREKPTMGKPDLVERLFIDYYGCPDTVYYRELSKLILIASVARVEEPGCKFDYAIIVEGVQGTRKSSSIAALYGPQYFGEIEGDLGNLQKTAEQIAGKWVLELPELSAMHKSEANDAKAFMTRQADDVRMVYDRNKSKFPRQCVVWGTTNDQKYLRDHTGGRRYLIAEVFDFMIDCDGIIRDRDAIWQAAARGYDEMREEAGDGPLPLFLTGEADATAKKLQERARKTEAWETWLETILDWMDEEHTLQSFLAQNAMEIDEALDESHLGYPMSTVVCRVALTQEQALREALGQHSNAPSGVQTDLIWKKVKDELESRGWYTKKCRIAGVQRRWLVRGDADEIERAQGFRILNSAQAQGIASPQVDDEDGFDMI